MPHVRQLFLKRDRALIRFIKFLQSSGDLENNENVAAAITKMLQTAAKIPISGDRTQTFKRMSGMIGSLKVIFYPYNDVFLVR